MVADTEVVPHMGNGTGRQERETVSTCSELLHCCNMAGDQCLHPSSATFNDASCCHFCFLLYGGTKVMAASVEVAVALAPELS